MLYPDFHDLLSLGNFKSNLVHPSHRSVKSVTFGGHQSFFRGQGLELDSVREYVPGDDIRNIDWRVTARTGSPHLKLFKEERERNIVICIDKNATMQFGTRNTFKSVQAARIMALLGWGAIARQDRIGACFFGDVPGGVQFFAPKRTKRSFCSLLQMLTQKSSEQHQISLEKPFQQIFPLVHTGSLVYVISDFMEIDQSAAYEVSLASLSKKCDVVFICVNDPADQSIYPVGTIGFRSSPSQKIYVNTESLAGRKAYADLWRQHEEHLQRISSRYKIPVLKLTTQSDVQRDLALGLKSIAKWKK
jgi:uncharacterized protein (DUF58 family)